MSVLFFKLLCITFVIELIDAFLSNLYLCDIGIEKLGK